MASGFQTTLDLLATTRNEAAVDILLPQLKASHAWLRDGVFETLLRRRSPVGHREVLRQLRDLPNRWRPIVQRYCGRMSTALRDAIVGKDEVLFQNACHAILWFHEYDLMPALVNAAEDRANPNADSAAATVLRLAEQLYEEIAGSRNYQDRRDPLRIRIQLTKCLELSLSRYSKHQCKELVEAFLVLAGRENQTLKGILKTPFDPRHRCVVESLSASPLAGIMRLLLGYLDVPHAPRAVIQILGRREDIRFVVFLLHKVHAGLSDTASHQLKKIDNAPWLSGSRLDLDRMDDTAQCGLVCLVMASGIPRTTKLNLLARLLKDGSPLARREACAALYDFSGQQVGDLVFAALDDPEPEVQAQAVLQIRQRGIPGMMNRLITLLESPHEVVRQASRSALDEFTFDRFLASFETLDEHIRLSTGELVRKVDPDSADRILSELEAPAITRRIRAIEMAVVMSLVPDIADELCAHLEDDEDHFVRSAVADALSQYDSPQTRTALSTALGDRSRSVQEAAKSSLIDLGAWPNETKSQ